MERKAMTQRNWTANDKELAGDAYWTQTLVSLLPAHRSPATLIIHVVSLVQVWLGFALAVCVHLTGAPDDLFLHLDTGHHVQEIITYKRAAEVKPDMACS
jgi:hypothetical protein